MTQGRDGSALAHAWALKLIGVARRLSLVAAVFAIAALVAGTAGTSYAKSKKKTGNTSSSGGLQDSVVVSNYGAVMGGSLETFLAGAGHSSKPKYWIHGPKSLLGASTGAAGDAVSSADAHIAVALPIDFFDLTGCGPFGLPANAPAYGTGLVEIFGPDSNGDSAAENIICSPNFAFGAPNTTGVFYPQGVAFESPYDGVNPGHDIVAVANQFPIVVGPDEGVAACAPAPTNIEPTKGHRGVCGAGPVGPGSSLGTITLYDRETLAPGLDNDPPFNNNPVDAVNPFTLVPYPQNATIGGCLSILAGPAGLTFDQTGYLYVVNNAGFDAFDLGCAPRFMTVYAPGSSGDVFPTSNIGYAGPTAGDLVQPVAAAVLSGPIGGSGYPEDIVYVTDGGEAGPQLDRRCTASGNPYSCCTAPAKGTCATIPPSIKIFNPFTNFDGTNFFFDGELLGVIEGPHTKLKSPMGIAFDADGSAMYVASTQANSLEMFTNFPSSGGDIPPTLIIKSPASKMNLPVGVALPAFTPTPEPTPTATATATATATEIIKSVATPAPTLH